MSFECVSDVGVLAVDREVLLVPDRLPRGQEVAVDAK
jgi:hypothetical protein